jgi:hypothetical protein
MCVKTKTFEGTGSPELSKFIYILKDQDINKRRGWLFGFLKCSCAHLLPMPFSSGSGFNEYGSESMDFV